MSLFLYNLLISLFRIFIFSTIGLKGKLKEWVLAQKQIKYQYSDLIQRSAVFFIASSGEFEQAKPLIEKIKEERPELPITACFFSPSGYNQLKNHPLFDQVIYTPLDTKANAKEFVEKLQPKLAVFVKYELWLNLMIELRKSKIPRYLISAVFSKNHFITKWYGKLWLKELQSFNQVFVQNIDSKKLLNEKVEVEVAGDTRIDRSLELPKTDFADPVLDSLSSNTKKIILGSAWPEDLEQFAQIKEWLKEQNVQLIIAPHELNASFLEKICQDFSAKRYTSTEKIGQENLLIDTIGILKFAYRYADIAYIGGGFGKGIHNTLEPTAYGLPVIFGPNYKKFIEAQAFLSNGGGFSVANADELKLIIKNLLTNQAYKKAGANAKHFLETNQGATEKIFNAIFKPN